MQKLWRKLQTTALLLLKNQRLLRHNSEIVEGMQFDRGYITQLTWSTDTEKMEAVIDDAYILITDKKISNIQEILPLLETNRSGR